MTLVAMAFNTLTLGYFIFHSDEWNSGFGFKLHILLCIAACTSVIVFIRMAVWPERSVVPSVVLLSSALLLSVLSSRFSLKGNQKKLGAFTSAVLCGVWALTLSRHLW